MHLRVVEPVAQDAPCVDVHLPPLGAGLDPHRQPVEPEPAVGRLLAGARRDDAPPVVLREEDLLEVGRERVAADAFQDHLFVLGVEVVELEPRARPLPDDVGHALVRRAERAVVAGRARDRADAVLEAVGVDLDRDAGGRRGVGLLRGGRRGRGRLLRGRLLGRRRRRLRLRGLRLGGRLDRGRPLRRRRLLLGGRLLRLLLVALRQEERRAVLGEDRHVDARRVRVDVVELEAAKREIEVAVGDEVEVASLRIEDRLDLVRQPARQLHVLAVRERVDPDGRVLRLGDLRVGDPLRVGRPDVVRDVVSRAAVDVDDLSGVDLDVAEPLVLVAEGELGRVGRPDGGERPAAEVSRHLSLGAGPVLRPHVEIVVAAAVAVVGDPPPVGRPRRVALPDAGAVGEVSHLALLARDGEELAARREDRARAGRRDVGRVDVVLDVLEVGHRLRRVAVDADRHALVAPRRDVVAVDVAARLVDDGARPGARPERVVVVVLRELADLLGLQVVAVEVVQLVRAAIGREDHGVAEPPRVHVLRRVPDDRLRGRVLEIEDPEVLVAAAAVAFPRTELAADRRVDVLRAVGRERAVAALGHRERRLHSAVDRDDVGAHEPVALPEPVRVEEHLLAVRRPVEHLVVDAAARRQLPDVVVVGELARLSAVDRDDVDLSRPGVLPREGDPPPVGRELREELLAGPGGQAPGSAAGRLDDPHVAAVDERDLVGARVRVEQESREIGGRLGSRDGRDRAEESDDERQCE